MDDDQQFCLRWNNHQSTLVSVFDTLLEKGMHVDCTLAAEGQTLKAHKVVLSACSPYFEIVLAQQFDKHPIIILKDVKYAELRAMMDYMYRGEVNISQDQLAALLKAAESLQIKGLSDNKPSRPPSRPAQAVPAHPPRAPSPPPQPMEGPTAEQKPPLLPSKPLYFVPFLTMLAPQTRLDRHATYAATDHEVDVLLQARDGSIDSSREGSVSPTRRRKKARRMSNELPPAPLPPPNDNARGNGDDAPCKEELTRDGVEDLTLDEEPDDTPAPAQNDVVRNFQWHMERSQDDIMNSSDGARESQELHKDNHLPSALLSLLSVQQAQSQSLVSLVPSCIQVTNIMKPSATKDIAPYPAPLHIPKLPLDTLNSIPENIKAHLLQQAFMQNNNTVAQNMDYKLPIKQDDTESDAEYDDTDDIVLPEESDTFYDSNGGFPSNSSDDVFDTKPDMKGHWKRDGNSSDDASRQFECKHCGKKYRWKSTLRRHENVECGGKAPSHQCPYCSYKAKQRGNLGVHIRKHHNNEWYIYASNKVRRNKKTSI